MKRHNEFKILTLLHNCLASYLRQLCRLVFFDLDSRFPRFAVPGDLIVPLTQSSILWIKQRNLADTSEVFDLTPATTPSPPFSESIG